MRWFQHDCDMHTDLKIQNLMAKHGCEGYTIWCLCLELVGKEGQKGIINSKSGWQNGLIRICGWPDKVKLTEILNTLADLNLINRKSLNYGNLYVPKFLKRSDNWTKRLLQSGSVATTAIDYNRLKDIRIEYTKAAGIEEGHLKSDDYGRIHKNIKALLLKADQKDDLVIAGIHWITEISAGKWSWTLETLLKKWPEFMKWNSMGEIERKYTKK